MDSFTKIKTQTIPLYDARIIEGAYHPISGDAKSEALGVGARCMLACSCRYLVPELGRQRSAAVALQRDGLALLHGGKLA